MTYRSLVNMGVEYGVMLRPMDDIWVIGQRWSRVWCHGNTPGLHMGHWSTWDSSMVSWEHPWMTYGSLVNMGVEYGVMVTPMDDIWVIGQHGRRVWCHGNI